MPQCAAAVFLTAAFFIAAGHYNAVDNTVVSSADVPSAHIVLSNADVDEAKQGGEACREEELVFEDGEAIGGVQLDVPTNIRMDKLVLDCAVTKPLKTARVSSLFGYRKNPVSGKYSFHSGYDLAAPSGSEIYAMLDGKVSTAGYDSGYGNYIILDHGDGLQTLYAHCSELLCEKGDSVCNGERIALVGSTGNSTGPHLHVEFRRDGQRFDPEWILGGIYS